MTHGTIEHPDMAAINAAWDRAMEPECEEEASIYYQGRIYHGRDQDTLEEAHKS